MIEAPNPTSGGLRWTVYASYVVVLGMIACFATISIQFLQWLFPTWDARGMVVVCVLAALEAVASYWLIKRLPTAQRQIAYYRVTEWIIILIILKFFTELLAGPVSFWNNLLLWPDKFPSNILTTHYLLTILPVFVTWQISNLFAADLSLLGADETAFLNERTKMTPIRDLILRRYMNLGMFVILLAGIPPQGAIPTALPIASDKAVPAVVMYFVLGIILLSLTRYTSLVTIWHQAKINVPVQIPQRWFAYSAVILGILVVLVTWLPTNYGMGFFETFTAMIGIIYQALATVYALIWLLFNHFMAQLFGRPTGALQGQVQPETPLQNNLPTSDISAINWVLLKSIFFWVVLIILVVVALRQYISFNQDLLEELKRFKPLNWLFIIWKRFTTTFKKANKTIGAFVQSSIKRLHNVGKSPARSSEWGFINPRRLNPRQKIIFYYLALVRRADEAGLPRKDGQTPYEYAQSLTSNLEEGQDGVDALTESFVEARYSRHDIPLKEARRVESIWETIRRVLRIVRKSRREEKHSKDD
jgi:hypothetical protein